MKWDIPTLRFSRRSTRAIQEAPSDRSSVPKTLWIVWLQGWDSAPDIVKASALSWRRLNPGWDVRYLDATHIRDPLQQKKWTDIPNVLSDFLRLDLLCRYGGVWADATSYCLTPLDRWLRDNTPQGFFAFDRPTPDRMMSNWFLAAVSGSPLIAAWQEACEAYWADRSAADAYFWMHGASEQIYQSNKECKRIWDETPKLSAGGPHSLDPYLQSLPGPMTNEIRDLVENARVPLLKLTHKINHNLGVNGSVYRWLCIREMSDPSAARVARWDGRL